ncbi:MAG: hypothetical protein E7560_00830 [Ruminococcaceae bacterium]|nr:hypothetical protein [Oscillospiraceae bacterium]
MAIGFRKSLLGFNCNDVMDYIERTHKNFISKEKNLSEKIDELSKNIENITEQNAKLEAEKLELDNQIKAFNAKYEEIERLSENIGKLYLVAQTNAQTIIENSKNNAEISNQEVNRNLYSIDEAHESLEQLRNNISKTSSDFIAEVEKLMNSLTDTRLKIAENNQNIEDAKKEFTEIFESIVQ